MRIGGTVSNHDKTNYDTNSSKVIKTFVYNGAAVIETLGALDLDIFMSYALKVPLLSDNCLRLLSRVLNGMAKTQFEESIQYFHNQVLGKCNDEATQYISGCKEFFDFLKEDEVCEEKVRKDEFREEEVRKEKNRKDKICKDRE